MTRPLGKRLSVVVGSGLMEQDCKVIEKAIISFYYLVNGSLEFKYVVRSKLPIQLIYPDFGNQDTIQGFYI